MKSQENPNLKSKFMKAALLEAKKAFMKEEVPVGAVVVHDGKIIARAHNLREEKQAFHAHAEFLAMLKASKKIGSWRLEDCDVYVTLEPCPMCAGALIQSRIRNLYYAAKDPKTGSVDSVVRLLDTPFNHQIHVESGLLETESKELLQSFFRKLREK